MLGFGLLVLPFWLVALGVLFLGRWPRGVPPAWSTGRAQPWPGPGGATTPPEPVAEDSGAQRNGEVDAIGPGVRKPDAGNPGDIEAEGGQTDR